MPEIVEVCTIASVLNLLLAGRKIASIEFDSKSKFSRFPIKNFDSLILPTRIKTVTTRGKKIIFTLKSGQYIISSLGMEGRWVLKPEANSNLWINLSGTKKPSRVYYEDSRHFGEVSVALDDEDLKETLKSVGYCLVTQRDLITKKWWLEQFSNKRIKKPVCDFLLDQTRFSGIGNWIRAEVLYRSKISPHRKLNELSEDEIETLRQSTFNIIDEALECRGVTLSTYKDPSGRKGTFVRSCYGRETDPLGNKVKQEMVGAQRTIHWVPKVQK